jgi:hypothetical protein
MISFIFHEINVQMTDLFESLILPAKQISDQKNAHYFRAKIIKFNLLT